MVCNMTNEKNAVKRVFNCLSSIKFYFCQEKIEDFKKNDLKSHNDIKSHCQKAKDMAI